MLDILTNKDENGYITIPYLHIHQKTEKFSNNLYCQDVEPVGEYMSHVDPRFKLDLPNYEYGTIKFKNPLIVEFISTTQGGWKTQLSEKYNNSTKKRLSNKILKVGYDSIIAYDSENNEIMEIVNLAGIKVIE